MHRTPAKTQPTADVRGRSAFTLIELLVVITIIAILISMLLPSLRHSRDAARVVACSARMGQAVMVMSIYENDHRGTIPRLQDHGYGVVRPSYDVTQELDKTWVDVLCERKYMEADLETSGVPVTLRCPSADLENDPTWAGHMPHFSLNFMLSPPLWLQNAVGRRSFYGRPSVFSSLLDRKIFMVESKHLDNPRGWFGSGNSNWVGTRHDKSVGANVAYLAGNVAFRKASAELPLEDLTQPFAWINFARQAEK